MGVQPAKTPKPRRRHLRASIARALDLPVELLLDLPRLIWIPGEHLTVENHRGILQYTPQLIRIRVPRGYIVVEGSKLKIESMTATHIVLEGQMFAVRLEEKPLA